MKLLAIQGFPGPHAIGGPATGLARAEGIGKPQLKIEALATLDLATSTIFASLEDSKKMGDLGLEL